MQQLLHVKRDHAGRHPVFYLRYGNGQVARTISVTKNESIAMDLDAANGVIGIELISPNAAEFEILGRLAQERGLSLDGLLATATA